MSSARNYCFTLFQYSKPLFTELPDWANYIVYQEEKAGGTDRLHLQGYINLKKAQRMSFLKKQLGNTVHLETCRGTATQNKEYCTKEDTRIDGPWEFGVMAEKGSNKRKIMEQYKDNPEEMMLEDPKLYRRCLARDMNERFKEHILPDMNRPWQVIIEHLLLKFADDNRVIFWIYGSEGNEGKTTWAKKKIQEGWKYSRGGSGDKIGRASCRERV